MKKIFIIPYFGEFNDYFQLFLSSCKLNEGYEWLIITDDRRTFDYPVNVHVVYMSFVELEERINQVLPIFVNLSSPYKLCDLKPAYGLIFQDWLTGFDFWGYCDTDMIFGRISDFISDSDLREYDKIGDLGHFTLIKNKKVLNELFLKPVEGREIAQEFFRDFKNHSFDEEYNSSINNIFEYYGFNILRVDTEANFYTKSNHLRKVRQIERGKYAVESKNNEVYVWVKGKLLGYEVRNSNLQVNQYLYAHFQSRRMKVEVDEKCDTLKIIPNSFCILENKIENVKDFKKIKKYKYNIQYLRVRTNNLYDKIRQRLNPKFRMR